MCQVVRLSESRGQARMPRYRSPMIQFWNFGFAESASQKRWKRRKQIFKYPTVFFLALVGIFSFCPWSAWRAARVFRPQSVFVIDSRVACACFCSALGQSSWGFWARPKGALLGLQCIYSLEIAGRLRRNRLVGVKSALFCEKETTTSLVPEVSQRHAAGLNQNRTVLFKKKNKMFPRL